MGTCRALNVVCGVVGVSHVYGMDAALMAGPLAVVSGIWFLYITAVTWYSRGEEDDSAKKRRVGLLVGGIIYLQLAVLIYLTMRNAGAMPLLVAGAVLLVLLRLFKRAIPKVSAS